MKNILTLFLFCFTSSYAQVARQTPQDKFKNDLANNKITLYVMGGIASRTTEKDIDFINKYPVVYHDFGCLAPPYLNEYRDYNFLVLNYLTEKYGKAWEKDIRKDILGWNKWNKK